MMRRPWCAWTMALALSILMLGARPAAADWSVGNNFGLSILMPSEGGDTSVLVDVPSGSGLGFFLLAAQPGLRFGFTNDAHRDEFHLDTGLSIISGNGDSFTTLQITGNYQHAFGGADTKSQPYVTAGLGTNLVTGGGTSVNALVLGGGVGQRLWVADGHGSVRFELRFDRIGEVKESGFTVQQAMNSFQMRFGFDLWPN
jgi:hypothetical protein